MLLCAKNKFLLIPPVDILLRFILIKSGSNEIRGSPPPPGFSNFDNHSYNLYAYITYTLKPYHSDFL